MQHNGAVHGQGICDWELAAVGAPAGTETARAAPVSPAGQAVWSAASTAAELGVSVKAVGFHLRRIFGKLGI
jgi:hypothetical protein